jgi:hypothetical protein
VKEHAKREYFLLGSARDSRDAKLQEVGLVESEVYVWFTVTRCLLEEPCMLA